MDEATIRKSLTELCQVIATMPAAGSKKTSCEGVYHSEKLTNEAPTEDSLNQLRLQIKYLVFDLEATRRENRYLRQMLENRHGPRSDGSKED